MASEIPHAATKRKWSDRLDFDELKSESEESESSSQSGSEYAPYGTGDTSDESDDTEPPPTIPCPKRVKKPHSNLSFNQSTLRSKVTSSRRIRHHKGKKKNRSDPSAPMQDSASLDSNEGGYAISRGERNALINNLTRERAKQMLEAIELPGVKELSPDERRTAHQLLTRGCMPAIPRHWEKDFPTLPESLFFSVQEDESLHSESEFALKADKGTEFYAIRAFQALLKISGIVRDHCNILEDNPEVSIKKSIEKYLRWAFNDAHIRVQSTTTPVHVIYCKKAHEGAKAAFSQAFKSLEKLASTWRNQIPSSPKPAAWPSVMAFVICGPVLSIVTLDCDPNPQTDTQGMRLLGQFDLSNLNNDVWNTLAVAISVMHVKRTMIKLAQTYQSPYVAPIVKDVRKCTTDIDK